MIFLKAMKQSVEAGETAHKIRACTALSEDPSSIARLQFRESNALFVVLIFQDTVSLCSPGTHSVDQAGLEPRNTLASAYQVLGLKGCTTTHWFRRKAPY